MRTHTLALLVSAAVLTILVVLAHEGSTSPAASPPPATQPAPLYDDNPRHVWNRLQDVVCDRTAPDGRVYGHDRVDPLFWPATRHLLDLPSREAALAVLREFLDRHGEKLIDDPLKRAMLQRDLWAMFDWLMGTHYFAHDVETLAPAAQAALRRPLALAIGRLALSPDQIDKLPDTYAAAVASRRFASQYDPSHPETPFLPSDLLDATGPWVCVGRNGSDIIAPAHSRGFSRSAFQVFLHLPGGRKATLDYLSALRDFKQPFVFEAESDGRFVARPNPKLPQFPIGTQVALLRTALLVDSQLHLRATRIVESVQLRVYRRIPEPGGDRRNVASGDQDICEFTLSRAALFAGAAGGLRAVGPDERDFGQIPFLMPMDPFEPSPDERHPQPPEHDMGVSLQSCIGCHNAPGVLSFNSFVGGFSAPELNPSVSDTDIARGTAAAIGGKASRYDWGLLQGILLEAQAQAPSGR